MQTGPIATETATVDFEPVKVVAVIRRGCGAIVARTFRDQKHPGTQIQPDQKAPDQRLMVVASDLLVIGRWLREDNTGFARQALALALAELLDIDSSLSGVKQ